MDWRAAFCGNKKARRKITGFMRTKMGPDLFIPKTNPDPVFCYNTWVKLKGIDLK